MKRIILMRHAKSSWDNLGQADHDRSLNARGHQSTIKLGQWLQDNNYVPTEVICSTATRCMQTWAGLEDILKLRITPKFEHKLYHAHVGMMLEIMQAAKSDTVLMLGHNPGISAFAEELLENPPRDQVFYNYPTAATTVVDFDIADWSELSLRSGIFKAFTVPKQLGG